MKSEVARFCEADPVKGGLSPAEGKEDGCGRGQVGERDDVDEADGELEHVELLEERLGKLREEADARFLDLAEPRKGKGAH